MSYRFIAVSRAGDCSPEFKCYWLSVALAKKSGGGGRFVCLLSVNRRLEFDWMVLGTRMHACNYGCWLVGHHGM